MKKKKIVANKKFGAILSQKTIPSFVAKLEKEISAAKVILDEKKIALETAATNRNVPLVLKLKRSALGVIENPTKLISIKKRIEQYGAPNITSSNEEEVAYVAAHDDLIAQQIIYDRLKFQLLLLK